MKEAVEDFKKKSGYNITLHDPEDKLKDRTVTLDTGDVTFWQALGRFCDKAGLKEADAKDLAPAVAPPAPPAAPGGPVIGVGPALPPGVVVGPGVGAAATPVDGIVLADGRAETLPTDASSTVRVQALSKADSFGPAPDGELQIALRLSLEPKLQWQGVDKVTITKAIDDQKQELTQTSTDATPVNPVGSASVPGGPVFGPVPIGQGRRRAAGRPRSSQEG